MVGKVFGAMGREVGMGREGTLGGMGSTLFSLPSPLSSSYNSQALHNPRGSSGGAKTAKATTATTTKRSKSKPKSEPKPSGADDGEEDDPDTDSDDGEPGVRRWIDPGPEGMRRRVAARERGGGGGAASAVSQSDYDDEEDEDEDEDDDGASSVLSYSTLASTARPGGSVAGDDDDSVCSDDVGAHGGAFRCVHCQSFSPIPRFQHSIASPTTSYCIN